MCNVPCSLCGDFDECKLQHKIITVEVKAMKKDMEYVSSLPLRRLEKGDRVAIEVVNPSPTNSRFKEKFAEKFKNVKNGIYYGVVKEVTGGGWKIDCPSIPELNGVYSYHYGEKYHCYGISAREIIEK